MKQATRFKAIDGRIQLYDANGNELPGKGTHWDGSFYCYNNNLASLEGAPEAVGGDFSCYNNNLASLEGAPEAVGGGFDCYNNNLTSLEGAPEAVGGSFYCWDNNLTSLEGAPEERQNMFDRFYKQGYVFADGLLTELISKRGNVYKTMRIGKDEIVYVIKSGEHYAHGDTIKAAREALLFKTADRDVSSYENMPLETVKTPQEWAVIYHIISGACETGCRLFMESRDLKKSYTLAEILDATKGQYGYERFKEVVG